jgi:hypothetical protein
MEYSDMSAAIRDYLAAWDAGPSGTDEWLIRTSEARAKMRVAVEEFELERVAAALMRFSPRRPRDGTKSPPWLAEAAEALGEARPEDGAPLALNWTQVIAAIRELRRERDRLENKVDELWTRIGGLI